MDQIVNRLCNDGFSINNVAMLCLDAIQAKHFYLDREGDASLPFLIDHLASGPVVALELVGRNAVQRLIEMTGPEDPAVAKIEAPNSLRAIFGIDKTRNFVHCSASMELAQSVQFHTSVFDVDYFLFWELNL